MDLSIILPSSRPQTLAHVLTYIHNQRTDGIDFEVIVIQEADDFNPFMNYRYGNNFEILRQGFHHDHGATARDRGLIAARGQYVVFWDDDNIYYPHAAASLFCTAVGHDVGIVRVRHQGLVIPSGPHVKPGDIDSMCFCVRKDLAVQVKWTDGQGRYNDFRWITRLLALSERMNRSPVIVGEHL
jgi:glycosyltransferase involved in cell wall biosynthesis